MLEKIHIIVALLAALAITILSLFQDVTFYTLCVRLVIVIPIFYIIGQFFRLYLKRLFAPPPVEEKTEEAQEESEEQPMADEEGSSDAENPPEMEETY